MMQKDKRLIAFVCTGNTCRSPMAEGIFNSLAEKKGLNVIAESFGISAVSGMDISKNSVLVCKELGVDLSALYSTSINDVKLEKYERFFCMSESHARILSEYFFVPSKNIEVLGICDPYGGNLDIYKLCRDEIYNSVKEIIKNYED